MVVSEGHFFFESEIEDAYFKRVILPDPPTKTKEDE